jgi:hypothetical protein
VIRAKRSEKRMIKACERRILEFPLGMEAREIAKELKREGWFAWASDHESIILRIERVRANDTEKGLRAIPSSRSGLKVGGGLAEISNGASNNIAASSVLPARNKSGYCKIDPTV